MRSHIRRKALRFSALRDCPEVERLALFFYQRDRDQPLMCIIGDPTSRGARYSDSGGGPFLKGLLALNRCMDFPLLDDVYAFAEDAGATLRPGPG